MSGIVGGVGSTRSGVITDLTATDRPWKLINHSQFTFQYGGNPWSTGYTLPTGTGEQRDYWVKINWGDYRWSDETVVRGNNDYFGRGGESFGNGWNLLSVATTGVITVNNQNGGASGNLYGELRVWLMNGPAHNDYFNKNAG